MILSSVVTVIFYAPVMVYYFCAWAAAYDRVLTIKEGGGGAEIAETFA